MFISVILPCGGNSSRMGGRNKLLETLAGTPVIVRTMRAFDEIHEVGEMILCVNENFRVEMEHLVGEQHFRKPVKFVQGGETRQQSVANGFAEIAKESELICVHDGARPLVKNRTICRCIADAKNYSAAVVCVPSKDTVKISERGFVANTPERDRVFLTQTPQIFRRELYCKVLEQAQQAGLTYTDDSQLCEAAGVMPFITIGEYSNIKITTAEDLPLAEALLKSKD